MQTFEMPGYDSIDVTKLYSMMEMIDRRRSKKIALASYTRIDPSPKIVASIHAQTGKSPKIGKPTMNRIIADGYS